MALIVQKYGGTSVGTPERIGKVADRIARARAHGDSIAVVVSAMGRSTDDLIALAHQISENPPAREMDMLLTTGERVSMALLSMALQVRGVRATSLTGSQSGIITDSSHRRARIRKVLGDRIRHGLNDGSVVIVAGFQGVSEEKEITTLGRGGSDTTAVALAAALEAERCEIYTDVDGVFSADPRKIKAVRFHRVLSHEIMVEMALRGAGVLHPRCVELAKKYAVKLSVRSSFNEKEGTEIMSKKEMSKHDLEAMRFAGVSADDDKMLVRLKLSRPTVLGSVFSLSREQNLQMLAPTFDDGTLVFFIDRDAELEWKKHLDQLSQQGFLSGIDFSPRVVPVSVVGDGCMQGGGALARVLDALAKRDISVTIGSVSGIALTVAIAEHRADEAVEVLHHELIENDLSGTK